MDKNQITLLVTIILMMLVTYIPRAVPMQISSHHWSKWVKDLIEYLPVAIVGAITIPNLFIKNQSITGISAELLAGVITLICAYYSKNLIITVLVGTIACIGFSIVL